jgi:hypothetical protein
MANASLFSILFVEGHQQERHSREVPDFPVIKASQPIAETCRSFAAGLQVLLLLVQPAEKCLVEGFDIGQISRLRTLVFHPATPDANFGGFVIYYIFYLTTNYG